MSWFYNLHASRLMYATTNNVNTLYVYFKSVLNSYKVKMTKPYRNVFGMNWIELIGV